MKFFFSLLGGVAFLSFRCKGITGFVLSIALLLVMQQLNAQTWIDIINKRNASFYEIQNAFYDHIDKSKAKKDTSGKEDKEDNQLTKFKRWEWFMEPRVFPSGDITLPLKNWEEFQKYRRSNSFVNRRSLQQANSSGRNLSGNWTSLGPFTVSDIYTSGVGRIDFIRFDPGNSNIIWAGSPSGGLWKSLNGGASWSTNTDLLTVIGCADLAIDPTNTNIMYLATGDRDHIATNSIGVLKSVDGGSTWNPTGLSWTVSSFYRISKLLIHPSSTNIILAATNNGIYKTTNAGVSWTMTQSGDFTDIEFKPGAPATVYAVTKGNGLFLKSTNTATSFTTTGTGLPTASDVARYAIGVTPANANYVYVIAVNSTSSSFHGLYRSTNSGSNFSMRSTTPDIVGNYGWYNLSIAVNLSNANDVYVGAYSHWRSIDGGQNWDALSYIHPDVHALEFLPGSSTTIFSGNDGGIFKSNDNGTTWSEINNGIAISQMYRLSTAGINNDRVLAGLQDNGTKSLSGNTWNSAFSGFDGMECIIDHTNPNTIYAGVQYGQIYKSTDGGSSFSPIALYGGTGIDAYGSWVTPFVMHPTNHNTLLVGKSQVYRTVNGGTSWSQVGTISLDGDNLTALAYAPSNPNNIYAASRIQFYASTNGVSFTNRTSGLPVFSGNISYIAVSNTNPDKVWVTISGYAEGEKVYMSTNAGASWTNYSAGLPNLPTNCIVYQNGSSDALYAGTDIGVYYRNSPMSSWEPYFDGLPHVIVNELEIQNASGKIRAATYGRGLWESDLVPGCTSPSNTWIGSISTAWEVPANWSCGIVPGPNTDVNINSGTVVLNSNINIRSCTIKPGANLIVAQGFKLTVTQ